MKNQVNMFGKPPINLKNKERYKIQLWRNALQKYCDEQASTVGEYNGYCVCGNMNYCDLCKDSSKPNPCVKAIKEWCDIRGININYENYEFDKFIERIEK